MSDMRDMPSAYKHATPKAKKVHKCCECRGEIQPGEVYHLHSGIWDGRPSAFKVCNDCEELRERVRVQGDLHWDEVPPLECLGYDLEDADAESFTAIRVKRGLTTAILALSATHPEREKGE